MKIENIVHPFYTFFIALGLIVGIIVLKVMKYPEIQNNVKISITIPILVLGAIIGAKIPVILSYGFTKELLWTGKSYFGAVLGGFLFINIFKYFNGIKGYFGDRFTVPLCVSSGIGKIGCLLYGCCSGIPTDFLIKIKNYEDLFVHPVQIYESLFEFICAGIFIYLYKTKKFIGFHFLLYFTLYMLFRFFIEFIRIEPKIFYVFSIYQIMAIIFVPLFLILILFRFKENKNV